VAYAPVSAQYADYRVWGADNGDRATFPATVNIWEEKRDGLSGPQVRHPACVLTPVYTRDLGPAGRRAAAHGAVKNSPRVAQVSTRAGL
jgi:hypothetical protein